MFYGICFFRVKTALLGQFSPTGAHREDCGPLCEQCCRTPWIASLEKGIGVERAQTVQTTVVVQAGLFRGNGVSRATQSLSPCRRRTSLVHGCLSRSTSCPPGVDARIPRLLRWSSKKRACKRSLRGYGDLSRMGVQWNNTRVLSVFLLGPCYQKAWPMGMRRWKRRACCCMSWWSCVRRFVAASRRGGRAVLPGYSVLGCLISLGIWTHFSLYFGVVFVRVWGLLKVELSTDSSPRKRCTLARHLLIEDTVQVWLHVSQNISGVSIAQVSKMQTNPGVDFSGADCGCSFLSICCLPPVSQTLAAEALAISMEAPMGNAKDAAEERRLRRKGDNAKVRAPRRRPSSWRRRKERPLESIWGCSAVKEALSNQFQGTPVQCPGALGLDIPFFLLSLYCSDTRRTCVLWVSRTYCSWRIARRARTSQTFRGSGYRGGLGGRLRRTSVGLANRFPNFLSFPPDSILHPGFWNISQSSRVLGMSSENSTRLLVACGAGLLVIWMCARRAARGGCGYSMARGSSETCSRKSSGNGMSTRLPSGTVLSALLFSSGRFSPSRFSLDLGWTTPSLSQPNSNVSGSNWKLSDCAAMSDATIGATAAATLDAATQARLSLFASSGRGTRPLPYRLWLLVVCLTRKPGLQSEPRLILRKRCTFLLWMRSWRGEVPWHRCCWYILQLSLIPFLWSRRLC